MAMAHCKRGSGCVRASKPCNPQPGVVMFAEMLDEFARQIVETVPDALLILDETLRVQVANRSFYHIFQVSPEETDGRFIYDLGNGEWNIPALRRFLEEILPQKKTVESFEVEHDFPDIGLRVMLLNARQVYQKEADSSLILLVISDITERRNIERALATQAVELARSNEFARQIVETVPDAMLILDENLRVQIANRSFYQTFEVSPDETHGRFIYNLGNDQWNIPELRHVLEEILPQKKTVENFEVEHDFPDIGLRVMLLNARQVHQHEVGSSFILLVISDITTRRKVERVLANQALELTRSNSDLQQFAYVASHDLQEPLRMVTSYMKLLERRYKGKLDSNADQFIDFAVDGATRMQVLIDDLLAYARIATTSIPFTRIDSNKSLEHAIANLEIAIQESSSVITFEELPTVMADPSQLAQVFQNLIGNALKFHREEVLTVHISAEHRDENWLFSVRDNGMGIEPEFRERIFVIFQRLHKREEYSGTGIGLAICKKIIERHGGRIWVESQPGAGSTFWFTLPMKGKI
jgi:PAS domain S-box-containing protein